MKGSSLLNAKGWPKIHHPLPQTPRESQQLLSALTSSFRRQLDAADTHKPAQSANEHMRSILQNPLFRVVPSKPSYAARTTREDPGLENKLAENPMAVFDDYASAGTLNGQYIAKFLEAQLALIVIAKSDKAREAMSKTGAGTKVVDWFWASDSAARLSLFRSHRATKVALRFMVAEGLHAQISRFIRALARLDLGGIKGKIPKEAGTQMLKYFMRDYIIAELYYGRGFAAALKAFNSIHSWNEPAIQGMLQLAAVAICRFIVEKKETEQVKDVSASLFDTFCKNFDSVAAGPFWRDAIQVYHPSHPDAQRLLDNAANHIERSRSDTQQDDTVQVYLDGMRLLIEQKRYKDAVRLSTHIEQMLSDERAEILKPHDSSPELSELIGRLNFALG